ncbi:MAG: hypothetical protein JWN40_2244 [Phycisphaerales bacterium]|nr:hypothetical protein [Phycisphaerales bacterium]
MRPSRWPVDPHARAVAVLGEVIDALRMVGVLLTLGGALFSIGTKSGDFGTVVVLVTSLVTVPGLLYIIASVGLARRRYWAWVMSFAVSVLLMVALLVTFALITIRQPDAALMWIPGILLMSMPGLILFYMLRALPVVREAELLGAPGFAVLPAVRDGDETAP